MSQGFGTQTSNKNSITPEIRKAAQDSGLSTEQVLQCSTACSTATAAQGLTLLQYAQLVRKTMKELKTLSVTKAIEHLETTATTAAPCSTAGSTATTARSTATTAETTASSTARSTAEGDCSTATTVGFRVDYADGQEYLDAHLDAQAEQLEITAAIEGVQAAADFLVRRKQAFSRAMQIMTGASAPQEGEEKLGELAEQLRPLTELRRTVPGKLVEFSPDGITIRARNLQLNSSQILERASSIDPTTRALPPAQVNSSSRLLLNGSVDSSDAQPSKE